MIFIVFNLGRDRFSILCKLVIALILITIPDVFLVGYLACLDDSLLLFEDMFEHLCECGQISYHWVVSLSS